MADDKPTLLQRVVALLPADRREAFFNVVYECGINPKSSTDLIIAYVAVEALRAKLDDAVVRMESAAATVPDEIREAGKEITRTLAADIAKESVEAIKVAVSGEIVKSVLAAKTSLETIAQQHRDTMADKAGKFGVAAEAATSKLVDASTAVRNHAATLTRLHLSHVIARAAWMVGGMVLAGTLTFGALHWVNHASCMHTANRFSTHAQRAMLEGVFCK